MMRRALACLCLAISGCTVGQDYQAPQTALPASWKSIPAETPKDEVQISNEKPSGNWWRQFNDPVLDQLIERAAKNNKDLVIAGARVREARADQLGANAALLPAVTAEASASRGNQGLLSLNKTINLYEAKFDAAWEIDIFGGQRRKIEAAGASVEAGVAARQNVLVSLLAEVARNYIEARNAQNERAPARVQGRA